MGSGGNEKLLPRRFPTVGRVRVIRQTTKQLPPQTSSPWCSVCPPYGVDSMNRPNLMWYGARLGGTLCYINNPTLRLFSHTCLHTSSVRRPPGRQQTNNDVLCTHFDGHFDGHRNAAVLYRGHHPMEEVQGFHISH